MKKLLFISVLFFCGLINTIQAASKSSNREFWVSYFGMNPEDSLKVDSTLQRFFVLVSSKTGCTGTITNPNTGYSQSFTVEPDSVKKIYIPYTQCYNHSDSDSVFVANRGVIVSTSDSASVYLGNYQTSSYDACAVFPVQTLGTSYRIACTNDKIDYWDNAGHTYPFTNYGSIVVVAIADSTKIRFNLASDVASGPTIYKANTDYDTTLNKGQTLAITGLALLGSTIKSTNCKRIAVFSGNYCSNVPADCNSCDLLVEQMEPINTWGEKFLVKSTLDRTYDSRIYVMANKDSTTVTVNRNGSSYSSSINAGEYLNLNSVVSGTLITADKPVSVMQYAIGVELSKIGDPMMMTINPVEQMIKEAIFAAPTSKYVVSHYLEIFTQTKDTDKTVLDNASIGSSFSLFEPDTTYSVARIKITPTTHYLKNTGGFLAYVYGYDSGAYNTQESYGYSLNWSFYNLEDYFLLTNNDSSSLSIYYQTTDSTNVYNINDTITISRTIQSGFESVSWLLNGSPYAVATENSQAQLTWKLPARALKRGKNTLSMLIVRSCEVDTITSTLWLADITATDTSICRGDSVLLTVSMDMPGVFHWINGSDTIVNASGQLYVAPTATTQYYVYGTYNQIKTDTATVTVYVKQPSATVVNDTICSNETYTFGGQELSLAGDYLDTLTAANGCDSIVTLHLYVKQTATRYFSVTINEGESYTFNGSQLYVAGVYTQTKQNTSGCDSILILTLKVRSDSAVDIPQGFSPNGDGVNDYFVIPNIDYYPHNHILIFNRWGNKVYEASPYENKWDGKNYFGLRVGDDDLPSGTYFYILDLGTGGSKKKGYIYLQR